MLTLYRACLTDVTVVLHLIRSKVHLTNIARMFMCLIKYRSGTSSMEQRRWNVRLTSVPVAEWYLHIYTRTLFDLRLAIICIYDLLIYKIFFQYLRIRMVVPFGIFAFVVKKTVRHGHTKERRWGSKCWRNRLRFQCGYNTSWLGFSWCCPACFPDSISVWCHSIQTSYAL